MSKMHDEINDVKILSRGSRVKVDEGRRVLRMSKGKPVGIRTWVRIDFLTHHGRWTLVTV